jgi:hypothetical protein
LVWKLVLVNTTSSGTASFGLETGAGEHHKNSAGTASFCLETGAGEHRQFWT